MSLAFDRSVRSFDESGRLHIANSHISKATVNPYFGKEIPGYEKMGLNPDQKYFLLRHPDELKKAEKTFNNIPVLKKHIPVSAEAPRQDLIIGTTGTDAVFNPPYLDNSLAFWSRPEIDEIDSGKKKQLSCAYSYDPIMEPGIFEGMHYDGIMTNIKGNHVALVEEGRAGPDVVVGDSALGYKEIFMPGTVRLSPKASVAKGALMTYLRPRLAQDARIDLTPILEGVTSRNFKQKRPIIEASLKIATRGKVVAQDGLDGLEELLEHLEGEKGPEGPEEEPEQDEGGILSDPDNAGLPDLPIRMDHVLHFLKDRLAPDTFMRAKDELNRAGVESDPPFGSNVSQMNKDKMRREADDADRRARKARDRLGRDETEEEEEAREASECKDKRHDDADDRRLMRDYRHARDRFRRAKDALDRRRDADDRRHDDADDRRDADDKRRDADDARKAKDAMDRAFDAWDRYRHGKDKRHDDADDMYEEDRRRDADDRRRDADDRRRAKDRRRAEDEPPDFEGKPSTGVDKAMDAAAVDARVARAIAETKENERAINNAVRFVRPWVGDLNLAFDSANDVYKTTLKMLGKDVSGKHPDSFKPILESIPRPGTERQSRPAMDSGSSKGFSERFPETSRIQIM